MRRRPRGQRGFTLLEMLVAFSIAALSLAMLYRASGSNARSADSMERSQRALLLAQSLLAMNDAVPPQGWNESGVSGGMAWHVSSSLYPLAGDDPRVPPMHELQVLIEWPDGGKTRQIEFKTLRPERKMLLDGVRR